MEATSPSIVCFAVLALAVGEFLFGCYLWWRQKLWHRRYLRAAGQRKASDDVNRELWDRINKEQGREEYNVEIPADGSIPTYSTSYDPED